MTLLVVGLDFSAPSRKALDAAVELARRLGAEGVVAAFAKDPPPPGTKRGALDPVSRLKSDTEDEQVATVGRAWVAEAGRHVPVELVVREGKAADVVLALARERKAAYVVVGSHGRTGLKRAVLGSVAEAVVRASEVPVLVVPA